ncbi:MAG: hypothetical protein JETT_0806 [Candidatus Jettenia ecosi]|uniref:Uncharacterized protein n=1 Tax=Candidatus Jettenia ecosi TaxID=2494326 RepID=A0A533QDT1_9BACT|nr:MAG: hypothetical protein JETT_0806 [Candidatus Jettenia ecosi]
MSPLSILPGRIRYENTYLMGKMYACRYLQECIINYLKGSVEVIVNHRTGRILVRFDEKQIDRQTLIQYINRTIQECKDCEDSENRVTKGSLFTEKKGSRGSLIHIANVAKHPFVEAVAHAFLPKPLNILVPIAIKGIMGRNSCNY